MTTITKPMLAGTLERLEDVRFPVLCTPKLDGIRCLKVGGRALTRSFKPIPNRFVREWIEANLPDGVDGELMLRHGTFAETTSAIGRAEGEPDFVYHIFDYVTRDNFCRTLEAPYWWRANQLACLNIGEDHCAKVLPINFTTVKEFEQFEAHCLAQGYEGVMLRDPHGPYKCGRSTAREGYLLKWKRFVDAEAVVLDTYERQHNGNTAYRDELGRTKRSTAQAGKVGTGELGGFVVADLATGIEFRLGYNASYGPPSQRAWQDRDQFLGCVVKYKSQPSGAKDAPRFPQFLGFREAWDMSN